MSKSTTIGTLLVIALAGLIATTPLASASSANGSFNPQTQFPIGSTVTVTSVYGLGGGGTPFFNPAMQGGMKGNWTKGQHNQGNWTRGQNNPGRTPHWNQTGAPPASFTALLTLTGQVTNDTANGGIIWTITSGSIVENGTTLSITTGKGGIGKLDRIQMGGNVTDSSGQTYRWTLQGLAAMYNGTVIASLNGFSGYNPVPAAPTTQQPGANKRPRGVGLTFIVTVT